LERNVDEFESGEAVNAQLPGSKGDGLFLLVILDIVHILCGPYLFLGQPMRHQRRLKPDNETGKSAKKDCDETQMNM